MKTFKNYTEDEFQKYFETDIKALRETEEDDIKYIEQNHFGDLLIEKTENDGERFNLWRNLDENIAQGESLIEIEYSGKKNGYKWETVYKGN